VLEYRRAGQSTWTTVTAVTKTLGTYVSGGIVADGSLAGAYEVDFPDAAFAAGARFVVCRIRGVANMLPVLIEIELDAVDYQDAAGFGLSRLDVTASSRMASYTQPTGFLAATFPETVASPTNITSATGIVLAGVTHTGAVIPTVTDVTTKTGYTATVSDKAGFSLAPTTGLGNQTANITGNLSGSVGSVTGAVGSVASYGTLVTDVVSAVWAALTSGLTTAGSIGKWVLDNLNATVSSRATLAQIENSTILAKDATVAKEATASSILAAIQNLNNLSAKMNIFGSPLLEIPDAGSTVYAFTVVVKDDEDKLVALDASPTITAANAAGTNRSANLSAVSNPSTGRYTFTYTVASTHAAECLRIAVSSTVSGEARYIEWIGAVVDYDTLTVLQQISTDLATKPTLVQIEASAVLAKEATINTRATQASVDSKPNLVQIENSTVLAKDATVAKDSTVAKQATLIQIADRIGAFSGSGVNTVLGFFRAIMRKDAGVATPSDVGGTYNHTTDSLEAIRDRGDEAWITGAGGGGGGGGGVGTGARAVSITVLDNLASPIQSATVRVSRSGQTFAAQTNASGLASFSLDDATWTVSITSPGYSFAPVSLVVGGTAAQTYSMTPIAPTPPAPFTGLCNVQFSVIHLGMPVPNASVVATLEEENPTVDNYLISRQVTSGVTDANGNCVLTMVQFSQFTRGGVYRIKVADPLGRIIHDRRVKIPSTSTANAEDLLDAR
jgi:hypothetical protein